MAQHGVDVVKRLFIAKLPEDALKLEKDILDIKIIDVIDDRTRIAADENVKIVKAYFGEFESIVKPIRESLLKPADDFQALRKAATDRVNDWIKRQNDQIGKYGQEMLRIEREKRKAEEDRINAERKAEQDRINAERKAEIDRINAENIAKAELEGTETIHEEFVPVELEKVELKPIESDKSKSMFVKGTVSEKPDAFITDIVVYANALLAAGDFATFKLVFDKPNMTQVNKHCKRDGINGREKGFPGLSVQMIPDVHQR